MFESKIILPLVGVIVGASVALFGTWYSNRAALRRENRKQIIDRLEELYMLCQDLYDGHKAEIQKLEGFQGKDVTAWLTARKHPGASMARIRLIVKVYAPHLKAALCEMSKQHTLLKETFIEIEASAKDAISLEELARPHSQSLNASHSALGYAAQKLKDGAFEEILRRLEIEPKR